MEIHYVNLARRADRRAEFLRANAGVADFQRLEAVDGRLLRVEDLLREGLLAEPVRYYTQGTLGAALSHKKIWDLAVAQDAPVTVAEDDALLNRRFAEKSPALLGQLPLDWDFVLWGWNFNSILRIEAVPGLRWGLMSFENRPLREMQAQFQQLAFTPVALRLIHAFGLLCYTISPKGALRFARQCFPLRDETIPVSGLKRPLANIALGVMMNKYYAEMNCYVSFPPLAWSDNDEATSDNFPPPGNQGQ